MPEYNEDPEIMEALDDFTAEQSGVEVQKKPKGIRKASAKELEKNMWIASVVDESISDGYIYSGAERQTQQAEAWRRYFREEYGNEVDGYSEYVSPMVQTQVNQTRAFITEQYYRNTSPIIKFRPTSTEDAEEANLATEWVNHIFRNKLDGHSIIDQTVMNAALLKICPVRVYMKEVRSDEPLVFKYEGKTEDLEDALASYLVANDLQERDPDVAIEEEKEEGMLYACYKWKSNEVVEKYPEVEVISPENFFISRQAESLESAKVVAKITNMRLGEIMEEFPDAPAMNGMKKSEYQGFWEQLQSDYQTWYSETTWFAKWSHDSLQYFEQYDNQNDDSAGLGTKELFVVDAEIYLDPDDSGEAKLCHIVKIGNYILYKKEISERSFMCGTLIPTANRWLGIGLWDILEQEAREETTLTRAFTDSAVQAAHPNLHYDPNVYESDDIYNRGPDTVIRAVLGGVPQQGVDPLGVLTLPGPDPSVQAAITHFKTQATESTGVGAGFQGATSDELSDMRMDKEGVKAIQNNSTLLLNFMARNYAKFLCGVLVKILDVSIKGGASPKLLEIQDAWKKVEPIGLKPRSDFILDADIGVNDAQEKVNKVNAIIQAVGLLTGQPGPDGQVMGIQAELLPTAGYEIGKMMLESQGALDAVDKIFVNPQVAEDAQVQAAIQGAVAEVQQQMQAQMAQMEEQIRQQVTMELQVEQKKAELAVEERKVSLEERKQDHAEDRDAFDAATKDVAEERREDADAYKATYDERKLDIEQQKVDDNKELKLRELDTQEAIAEKAAESKATAVVSP